MTLAEWYFQTENGSPVPGVSLKGGVVVEDSRNLQETFTTSSNSSGFAQRELSGDLIDFTMKAPAGFLLTSNGVEPISPKQSATARTGGGSFLVKLIRTNLEIKPYYRYTTFQGVFEGFEETITPENDVVLKTYNGCVTLKAGTRVGREQIDNRYDDLPFSCGVEGVDYDPNDRPPAANENNNMGSDELGVTWIFDKDEITIQCAIKNNQPVTREYRVFLYDQNGSLIQKEPDFSWKNAKPGQSITIPISSKYNFGWDTNTVYPFFKISLWEQHAGFLTSKIVNLTTGGTSDSDQHHTGTDTTTPVNTTDKETSGGDQSGSDSSPVGSGGQSYTPPSSPGGSFFDSFGLGDAAAGAFILLLVGIIIFLLVRKK